jgi:hypothetical protein
MSKQRLIPIVAVLCVAQLAIILSNQFSNQDSDLHRISKGVAKSAAQLGSGFSTAETSPAIKENSRGATIESGANNHVPPVLPSSIDKDSRKPPSRDPFVPFFSVRGNTPTDTKSLLTNYDLSELRVTAIIRGENGKTSASVETRDGKSFIVKPGTKIGKHDGTVSKISATSIYIEELASSVLGEKDVTIKELAMGAKISRSPDIS